MPKRQIEIWLPIAIVALDQATKALVRAKVPVFGSVMVVPGLVNITHVQNTGMAYGLLDRTDFPFKTVLIACIGVAALIAVGMYAASLAQRHLLARIGLALIIGGAAGNVLDRVTVGSVVDFVDVYWGAWHFWAFNVADSAISVGVGIMILDMLGAQSHVSKTV